MSEPMPSGSLGRAGPGAAPLRRRPRRGGRHRPPDVPQRLLLLVGYYILKTVREPLILLAGGAGAEVVRRRRPGPCSHRVRAAVRLGRAAASRQQFLAAVILFFVGCIQLFFLGSRLGVPHLGFLFFVWVGIFSLTTIAQFWSYANEIYTRPEGNRLFP